MCPTQHNELSHSSGKKRLDILRGKERGRSSDGSELALEPVRCYLRGFELCFGEGFLSQIQLCTDSLRCPNTQICTLAHNKIQSFENPNAGMHDHVSAYHDRIVSRYFDETSQGHGGEVKRQPTRDRACGGQISDLSGLSVLSIHVLSPNEPKGPSEDLGRCTRIAQSTKNRVAKKTLIRFASLSYAKHDEFSR